MVTKLSPFSQHGIHKSDKEKVTKVSVFHHFSSVSPFSLSLFIEKGFPTSLADIGCAVREQMICEHHILLSPFQAPEMQAVHPSREIFFPSS